MGTPLVENGFRAQLLFGGSLQIRPWSTKFDYKGSEGATLEDMAGSFAGVLETAIAALPTGSTSPFAQGTVLNSVRVYELGDPLSGTEFTPITPWPQAGGTSQRLPGEVAVVSSLRTDFLGRKYRGRQYWGSLSSSALTTAGLINGTFAGQMITFVNALNEIEGGFATYQHSVFSRTGPDVGTRYPAEAYPVTNVLMDLYPDTQRRRGVRG